MSCGLGFLEIFFLVDFAFLADMESLHLFPSYRLNGHVSKVDIFRKLVPVSFMTMVVTQLEHAQLNSPKNQFQGDEGEQNSVYCTLEDQCFQPRADECKAKKW